MWMIKGTLKKPDQARRQLWAPENAVQLQLQVPRLLGVVPYTWNVIMIGGRAKPTTAPGGLVMPMPAHLLQVGLPPRGHEPFIFISQHPSSSSAILAAHYTAMQKNCT